MPDDVLIDSPSSRAGPGAKDLQQRNLSQYHDNSRLRIGGSSVIVCYYLMLLAIISVPGAANCPEECVCMWKNGKETTECINRDKESIPAGIEPSTQVLDLRGNHFRLLQNDLFLNRGLTNIQRFFCAYCKVGEVEPLAFRRLTNLVELDLSENLMREVPSEVWKSTKALMKLNLSGNPIKLIRGGAFEGLKFVTNLALSHCDIETIEKGAFDSMGSLLELKLDKNKLEYLPCDGLFPKTLHHVEVSDHKIPPTLLKLNRSLSGTKGSSSSYPYLWKLQI